jgi:CBS domain-containing protein
MDVVEFCPPEYGLMGRSPPVEFYETAELILRQKGARVYDIAPDATVYEALVSMVEKGVGALVVIEGDTPLGLISERDYARKVILKGRSSREMKVREIMSSPIVIGGKTTVDRCMNLITEHRCRHLVVVEGDRAVGVVSIGDVVNWIITTQDLTIHQLEDYINGRYPG